MIKMKKIIKSKSSFPLSNAILHNNKYILEISGQIGVNPNGELAEGIENQTSQVLDNIKSILEEIGWDLTNVTKAIIYLSDMKDYAKMNETYAKYFTKDYPTRVALAVKELPRNALIEIECTASGDKIR